MYSYLPGCLRSLNLTLSYFLEVIGGGGGGESDILYKFDSSDARNFLFFEANRLVLVSLLETLTLKKKSFLF